MKNNDEMKVKYELQEDSSWSPTEGVIDKQSSLKGEKREEDPIRGREEDPPSSHSNGSTAEKRRASIRDGFVAFSDRKSVV